MTSVPYEPVLEIIDSLASEDLFSQACRLSAAKGWYYGHGSREGDAGHFWKMDLEGVAVFDAIWEQARERCEALAGAPLRVLRQYANGHTYGLGGQPHLDDVRPGSFTLLYYPIEEWREGWEGETVFYDETGEIALTVKPRPNRAVFFDSRILHNGRAPSRMCHALRVTVAYKLEAVDGPDASATSDPQPTEQAVREGPEKQHTVKVTADRVHELVEQHLTKLGETIRLPGFRPGKIPMAVLEKRYGAEAHAQVMKRLAADAAASVPPGSVVAAIDVSQPAGAAEFRLTVIHLPDLPDPDLCSLSLERLTASESDLQAAGLTADALAQHLKQQVLDHLETSYPFTLPGALVEREFAAIWQAAQSQGAATDDDAAQFRAIAKRRVRLGMVVAELARRYRIAGPAVEDPVVEKLISQATVRERQATLEELRELA